MWLHTLILTRVLDRVQTVTARSPKTYQPTETPQTAHSTPCKQERMQLCLLAPACVSCRATPLFAVLPRGLLISPLPRDRGSPAPDLVTLKHTDNMYSLKLEEEKLFFCLFDQTALEVTFKRNKKTQLLKNLRKLCCKIAKCVWRELIIGWDECIFNF